MGAFLYLYKTTFKNRIIKAIKRPVTYIYLIFIIIYIVSLTSGLGTITKVLHLDHPEGLAVALTAVMFFLVPANMIAYSKRKGIVFKPSEIHFIFTSPVTPKRILLYTHLKTIFIGIFFGIALVIIGTIYCNISLAAMLIYFLFSVIIENILEASIMVILYGNESILEKVISKLPFLMYGIMIIFVLSGFLFALNHGFSLESIREYLSISWIQCVPIIGWNIAIVRLILLGPTVLNIICTILYCLTTIIITIYAFRMKCTGEYYEDAMKFADDYQELWRKSKRGEIAILGKKKKYVNANIEYKGSYAKAIFYRQLLEYKKNKFFIFGGKTLISLIAGIGIVIFAYYNPDIKEFKEFIIVGVGAYITFIFNGYPTKWSKELENPYTFLIPDSPFRKVWYSTLIEHVRAAVDGCLLTIPGAIFLKINPIFTVLIIVIYVCLQANKLYAEMFAEFVAGNVLGNFGKNLIKMLVQTTVIGISVLAAVFSVINLGIEIGFLILLIVSLSFTIVVSMSAVVLFDKMETVN